MNPNGGKRCPYCTHQLRYHNMSNAGHGNNGDRCNTKGCLCSFGIEELEALLQ